MATDKETALEVKVHVNPLTGIEYPICPVCGSRMTSARAVFMKHNQIWDYAYCESCGQKTRWT